MTARSAQTRPNSADRSAPVEAWASPGADIGAVPPQILAPSRRKCGPVPTQMWTSLGADVGPVSAQMWTTCAPLRAVETRVAGTAPNRLFSEWKQTCCVRAHVCARYVCARWWLRVCACVCGCSCVRAHVCVRWWLRVCACVWRLRLFVCARVCVRACVCTCVHACARVCGRACVRAGA